MNICHQKSNDNGSILMVGVDLPNVPANPEAEAVQVVRQSSISDAIVAMRHQHFDRVVVSMSVVDNQFESSLSGLRQADPSTRIILLAHMLQEPLLIEQMARRRLPLRLFDDYLIHPVRLEDITDLRTGSLASVASKATDDQKDRRIEALERLVIQDDLTGLKNRRYLRQFLPQVLSLAGRDQLRVTLLIFDIDDFKHYNDAFGHAVGDNVLRQAGRMIQRCCRGHDVVARLGGDEFAVVFWDLPGEHPEGLSDHLNQRDRRSAGLDHPREPMFIAERFCKKLQQASFEFIGPKGKGTLTISGGLATFPNDAKTPEDLLQRADMAMLEAKRSGKNRIYLVGQPTSQ